MKKSQNFVKMILCKIFCFSLCLHQQLLKTVIFRLEFFFIFLKTRPKTNLKDLIYNFKIIEEIWKTVTK